MTHRSILTFLHNVRYGQYHLWLRGKYDQSSTSLTAMNTNLNVERTDTLSLFRQGLSHDEPAMVDRLPWHYHRRCHYLLPVPPLRATDQRFTSYCMRSSSSPLFWMFCYLKTLHFYSIAAFLQVICLSCLSLGWMFQKSWCFVSFHLVFECSHPSPNEAYFRKKGV